ncbi:hypothetical protein TNCV_1935351 [Trichonephila clavipes]|nr:hypothetical protein TNCV_1935351 [Trichonephila clavipes]
MHRFMHADVPLDAPSTTCRIFLFQPSLSQPVLRGRILLDVRRNLTYGPSYPSQSNRYAHCVSSEYRSAFVGNGLA